MNSYAKLLIASLVVSSALQFHVVHARDEFHDPLAYNLMLEDSLTEYEQHYGAGEDCDRHALDLYINPLYSFKWNGEATSHTGGAFLKGQLNFGNAWARVTTAFAQIKASNSSNNSDGVDGFRSSKPGVDDVAVKLGYDVALTDTHYLGFYLQGGFPTHNNKPEIEKETKETEDKDGKTEKTVVIVKTTPLGTKNFTLGAGIAGGFTIIDTVNQHLAFLFDTRYRYAFAANYGHIADEKKTKAGRASGIHSASTSSSEDDETKPVRQDEFFTPGSTINIWTALHYRVGDFNVELGNVFNTTFGSSGHIKTQEVKPEPAPAPEVVKPAIAKFSANPYIAIAYSTMIADYPTLIGLGVGYTYEKESAGARVNNIITPWVSLGMSF